MLSCSDLKHLNRICQNLIFSNHKMAGIVYLRTNKFEVKLEGITFKASDFESLQMKDYLFPKGKIWVRPPVVGIDVVRHPRDSSIVLMLLCFGLGCVIVRLHSREPLPDSILEFLTDSKIRFVGFGVQEKKDLFPFVSLGLIKKNVDVGYLASKFLDDRKYRVYELGELARKVLGIKKMVRLTEASSFERHEQVKHAICRLFITSLIAMKLLSSKDESKKLEDSPKRSAFLKNLHSLPLLAEGLFKLPKGKMVPSVQENDILVQASAQKFSDKLEIRGILGYGSVDSKRKDEGQSDGSTATKFNERSLTAADSRKVAFHLTKKPLKGILRSSPTTSELNTQSPPSVPKETKEAITVPKLRRANSRGCNVTFKST